MKEQSEQLNEIKEDIAIFFLHPDDVWQGKGLLSVDSTVSRGGPGKETKLEKVLHYNSQLKQREDRQLNEELSDSIKDNHHSLRLDMGALLY